MAVYVADEQTDVLLDHVRLADLATHVLRDRGVPDSMEVSVLCVDVHTITELNRTHMDADGATDVLAFPLDAIGESTADISILGDVVLCPTVAASQAADLGRETAAEIEMLLVHGILHLLGLDHAEADERRIMFELTDRLLADFAPPDASATASPDVSAP